MAQFPTIIEARNYDITALSSLGIGEFALNHLTPWEGIGIIILPNAPSLRYEKRKADSVMAIDLEHGRISIPRPCQVGKFPAVEADHATASETLTPKNCQSVLHCLLELAILAVVFPISFLSTRCRHVGRSGKKGNG